MQLRQTGIFSYIQTFFTDTYLYGTNFSIGPIRLKLILKLTEKPNDRHCTCDAVPFYWIALGFESKSASESGNVWVFVKPRQVLIRRFLYCHTVLNNGPAY